MTLGATIKAIESHEARSMSEPQESTVKLEAQRLVESLPDDVSWDDIMYRIYVRQCMNAEIADADAGRVVSVDEVRRRFGLSS